MKQGIDIKIFGLTGNVEDINAEVYAILDKCFSYIAAGKKNRQQIRRIGLFSGGNRSAIL